MSAAQLYSRSVSRTAMSCSFFFFNDTATTEIYTLSLHDALPIWIARRHRQHDDRGRDGDGGHESIAWPPSPSRDRKSTRLNSSHSQISYAVFCLKKKNKRSPTCFACPCTSTPPPSLCLARRHGTR